MVLWIVFLACKILKETMKGKFGENYVLNFEM